MHTKTFTGPVRWREAYSCWGCASKFQATWAEAATGQGETEDEARAAAAESVRQKRQADAGAMPCPLCGDRGRGHYLKDAADLYSGMPIILALIFALIAALTRSDILDRTWAAFLTAGFTLVFAIGGWRLARQDPNRDLAANRREAERLIREGILELQIEGNPNRSDAPLPVAAGWKRLWLVLPFIGAWLCAMPCVNVDAAWLWWPAEVGGTLLAVLSFAMLAYSTVHLYGQESLTGCEATAEAVRSAPV